MSDQNHNNPFEHEIFKSTKKEDEKTKKSRLKEEIAGEIEDIKDLEEEVSAMNMEKQPKSELHAEIIDLQQELQASRDKLLYALAEMENIRIHAKQDIDKTIKYGLEKFIKELVPIIDSLERAIESVSRDEMSHPMFGGVQLTLNMMLKVIENFGVKQIDPLSEPFDPKFHEAMSTKENSEVESNTVLTVLQKGYLLHDRLVRPALVIVSK